MRPKKGEPRELMKNIKKSHLMIIIFIFMSVFISFFYIDLTSLTIWSTNIWDCLFGEGLKNYYLYSSQNFSNIEHAIVGNDLLIYIPWAIWNFPIWVIGKLAHISISTNVYMLLYSKLFLVVVFCGVLIVTQNICKVLKIKENEIMHILFLTASSVFVMTSIAYAGQNDILPIFFFLLGVLYLLKGKQILFIAFVAISIAMKPYMLFSFIILLFLIEKNVWKLFVKTIAGVAIFILQKMVLRNFPYYQEAMNSGATDGEIAILLKAQVLIAEYEVSVLVLLLTVLAILAYFTKVKEDERGRYIIYFALAPLLVLFAVSGYSFYRPIYLIPLFYVVVSMNKKIPIYFQLFVEIVLIGFIYYQFLRIESLFYNPYYINNSLLGRVFTTEIPKGYSFSEGLSRSRPNLNYFFSISSAVILVCMFLFLILNHPKFNKKIDLDTWKDAHWVYYLRLIVVLLIITVAMSSYFIFRNN